MLGRGAVSDKATLIAGDNGVGDKVDYFGVDDTFQNFGGTAQKGYGSVVVYSFFITCLVVWGILVHLPFS